MSRTDPGKVVRTSLPSKLWHLALTAGLKQCSLEISMLSGSTYVEINNQVEVTEINAGFKWRNPMLFSGILITEEKGLA